MNRNGIVDACGEAIFFYKPLNRANGYTPKLFAFRRLGRRLRNASAVTVDNTLQALLLVFVLRFAPHWELRRFHAHSLALGLAVAGASTTLPQLLQIGTDSD